MFKVKLFETSVSCGRHLSLWTSLLELLLLHPINFCYVVLPFSFSILSQDFFYLPLDFFFDPLVVQVFSFPPVM